MEKILLIFMLLLPFNAFANNSLSKKIGYLEKSSGIKVGVSAIHIESGKFFHYRQDERFKMGSSVKVPIAMALLHKVRSGEVSLSQMVHLEPYDLVLGSGLMGYFLTYPSISISVHNLLETMIAISDNSSTDAILDLIGGPKYVNSYLKSINFGNIDCSNKIMDWYIKTSGITSIPPKKEWSLVMWKKMIEDAPIDQKCKASKEFYTSNEDTTSPRSMTNLLVDLYNGSLLGKEFSELLLQNMEHCTSCDRIPKLLPKDIKVAHKTGTWFENHGKDCKFGSFGDIGVIYLPRIKVI
ncbi:MAG UNVERIFIED_CONTAM: class A beta-lactamase-related serine hydrolase [Rickettsiaceae bacterium]|jgi:beta-lactamase class A